MGICFNGFLIQEMEKTVEGKFFQMSLGLIRILRLVSLLNWMEKMKLKSSYSLEVKNGN